MAALYAGLGVTVLHLPFVDNQAAAEGLGERLHEACDFMQLGLGAGEEGGGAGCVLVHCQKGVSRSSTVVIAYIMRAVAAAGGGEDMPYEAAATRVRMRRLCRPNSAFQRLLRNWRVQAGEKTPDGKTPDGRVEGGQGLNAATAATAAAAAANLAP